VLSGEDSFFLFQLNVDSNQHLINLLVFSIHNGVSESDDWFHYKGTEGSFYLFSFIVSVSLLPLLGLRVEIIVSPESFHHFWYVRVELLGINLGELGDGKGIAFLSGSEGNISSGWVKDEVSHLWLFIVGHNNINHIDDSNKILIHTFSVILEFQDLSVDFVYH